MHLFENHTVGFTLSSGLCWVCVRWNVAFDVVNATDSAASLHLTVSGWLIEPMLFLFSFTNECSATRIDCRLYDGFRVSWWKSEMVMQTRLFGTKRPLGVHISIDGRGTGSPA